MNKLSSQEFWYNSISYNNNNNNNNNNFIIAILQHIQNPRIFKNPDEAYWESRHGHNKLFGHFQLYSGTFSNSQLCSGISYRGALRHIQASLRHVDPYLDIFRTL